MVTSWYGYNAARTPWRIAVDYAWHGTPAAKSWLDKVTSYLDTNVGAAKLGDVVDGFDNSSVLLGSSGSGNSAFVGAFAVAAMASSQAASDGYGSAFLAVPAANDNSYYKTTLRALYMLLSANKFSPSCY
jgi:hypothetical protein